jgi:hypothetical protein
MAAAKSPRFAHGNDVHPFLIVVRQLRAQAKIRYGSNRPDQIGQGIRREQIDK